MEIEAEGRNEVMGDAADLLTEQLERGQSLVKNKITGEEKVVDNDLIMYSGIYDDETVYEITDFVD